MFANPDEVPFRENSPGEWVPAAEPKIGDVVALNSGGPTMTISDICRDAFAPAELLKRVYPKD